MTKNSVNSKKFCFTNMAIIFSLIMLLSACTNNNISNEVSSVNEDSAFPVTIADAFGTTTIKNKPKKIITLAWGSTDAVLALGITPIAIEQQTYGSDDSKMLPWVNEFIVNNNLEIPTILPQITAEPAYEKIASLKPDLILATYSGITKQQHALLSAIAPTVGYPDKPWSTPWREVVSTTAKAVGEVEKANQILADFDEKIATKVSQNQQLQNKTVAMVWDMPGNLYVYEPTDPRMQFIQELGLVTAPSVKELSNGGDSFFYSLSLEKTSKLTSDILVSFADNEVEQTRFINSSYAKNMQQIQTGAIAKITGTSLIAAVSPPTVLSLPWALDDYVQALNNAVNIL